MSEIYPHTVVGQLAGHSSTHVGWGRSITVLLPAWHSLGKPRSEDKVGVRASEVWERLWLHQILGPWGGGGGGGGKLARWKGWITGAIYDPAVDQGKKVSGSFYLMIWEIQSRGASDWMSLKCLESSSQLAQFTDVCEKLQRLQITSNILMCGHWDYSVKSVLCNLPPQ